MSSLQLFLPVHWMSQEDADSQSTRLHAPSPQTTRHATPIGHCSSVWQLSVAEQSNTHVSPSHVPEQRCSHKLGGELPASLDSLAPPEIVEPQLPATAGSAQNPSMPQTWPLAQSDGEVHSTVQFATEGS
jgi:hypothetical protein